MGIQKKSRILCVGCESKLSDKLFQHDDADCIQYYACSMACLNNLNLLFSERFDKHDPLKFLDPVDEGRFSFGIARFGEEQKTYKPTYCIGSDQSPQLILEDHFDSFTPENIDKIKALKDLCSDRKNINYHAYVKSQPKSIELKTTSYRNDLATVTRPSLEYVFMSMASSLAERSTCLRKKVGVVFTDKDMLHAYCLGYNGSEKNGLNQCDSLEPGSCGCIHAEINALTKNNVNISGTTCFVTLSPCVGCAKILINRDIKKVVYLEDYRDLKGIQLLKKHGVNVVKYDSL